MKVILNTITNYEGQSLKLGDGIDLPLNIAQRWINGGIAHPAKEEVKPIVKTEIKIEVKEIKSDKVFDSEFDGLNKEVKKDKKVKKAKK